MSFQLNGKDITLRAISDRDRELLYKIYCSTRIDEMNLMSGWSDLQKQNFLRMQFEAQHSYYSHHYINAFFSIILKNKKPIGRLYLHEKYDDDSIRIIDITIFPDCRNKGTGKNILQQLLEYAAKKKRVVTLHVEASNPAIHLYSRLGFKVTGTNNLHYLMEWNYR